jgi:23S rRNA G2445 N2-methylase RlmL
VDENADVEFWCQLVGRNALVGLRLSDATLRHRTYKSVNLPGSLRPTIARASVLLTEVADGDVFLDPMCGAGTILIERALAGRHRLLLGGDIDATAVRATIANFGGRHKPWQIVLGNAGQLALDAGSVDKVACNLPWARRFATGAAGTKKLYRSVLREVFRVMKSGGRGVFLTKRADIFREALSGLGDMKITQQTEPIAVLGQRARLIVVHKEAR